MSPDYSIDNGRIVRANCVRAVITNVDYDIIDKAYHKDKAHIIRAYRYRKAYLPRPLVERILYYYGKKTTLKGVSSKEAEYLAGKECVNSVYGMMVMDPVRINQNYDEESGKWIPEAPDVAAAIAEDNQKTNRFLFYPWGVFVTAYARQNLWTAIFECGTDYCYADTDSVKIINAQVHEEYFQNYDKEITRKLRKACEWHNLPFEMTRPKTIKGVEKPLGVWDDDGNYTRFKTLGAKRYMVEYEGSGKINITVSGLNKKKAVPYLLEKYGREGIFDAFTVSGFGKNNGLKIPAEHSGRLIMSYIDFPTSGEVVDYMGRPGQYSEASSVHMAPGTYELTLGKQFYEYLAGFTEVFL